MTPALTLFSVANRRLGLSRRTGQLLRDAGEYPVPGVRKIGGRWYVPTAELERYIAELGPSR
jgi:hypothetical protein